MEKEKKVNITKEKIQSYEDVRQSGETNMFDVKRVMMLSSLTREECIDIMKHYDEYIKKFNIQRRYE